MGDDEVYRVTSADGVIEDLAVRGALAHVESLASEGVIATVIGDDGREVSPQTLRTIVKLCNVVGE